MQNQSIVAWQQQQLVLNKCAVLQELQQKQQIHIWLAAQSSTKLCTARGAYARSLLCRRRIFCIFCKFIFFAHWFLRLWFTLSIFLNRVCGSNMLPPAAPNFENFCTTFLTNLFIGVLFAMKLISYRVLFCFRRGYQSSIVNCQLADCWFSSGFCSTAKACCICLLFLTFFSVHTNLCQFRSHKYI